MKGLYLSLAMCILLLEGCSSTYFMKMEAFPSDRQSVIYNDGKKTITSLENNYVSLAPYRELNNAVGKTSYILFVQNLGDRPITVGSSNVTVQFKDSANTTLDWQKINVQSFSEVLAEIEADEAQQKRAAMWQAVAGAINASSQAYSTSTTYNSGTVHGSYKSNSYGTYGYNPYTMSTNGSYTGNYNGISTTTTYDPAKAQMLANQNSEIFRNNLNSIAANSGSAREWLNSAFMKTQTIMPKEGYGGLVITDTRSMNQLQEGDFQIIVTLENEKHIFTVNRKYNSKAN